jgi:UDP-N-acetylglucosamine 2-epimerase (non-hydrolysing)
LQEECAALGIPLLLMRDETERPEVIASGNCILVGSDCTAIVRESRRLLTDPAHHARMSIPAWPYGKGDAADKILDAIADWHRDQRLR